MPKVVRKVSEEVKASFINFAGNWALESVKMRNMQSPTLFDDAIKASLNEKLDYVVKQYQFSRVNHVGKP